MAIFKCKMCGGPLQISENQSTVVCEYCGTQQTLPKLDDDRRANMYDRANHFRRNNEFDKAESIYENILNEDLTDAEAYWSLVLCRYGIEYVQDPATHQYLPTVNRAQFTSVFDDDNYKMALQYADMSQRAIYETEAQAINEIQKGFLAISQKEEPFDVFICYKETDNNGRRTPDSVLANDLYHQLTQEGFKVFFSRITLEDKLGTAYEPYIFAALNSARVMVVLGTRPEYFKAVWVKNEWSRYLSLVKQSGGKKVLIPAYKDMDPYDLPEEFSHLQAQDMGKLGFMQDLIRGIRKLAQVEAPKAAAKEPAVTGGNANIEPLLKRVFMYLEDGDWKSADEYCERVLDIDPENALGYLGKLMAQLRVRRQEDLRNHAMPFDNSNNYQKILRFGDAALIANIQEQLKAVQDRYFVEKQRKEAERCAAEQRREAELKEQAAMFLHSRERAQKAQGLIAASDQTLGVKSDGTVAVACSKHNRFNVSQWQNIVAVACGNFHAAGLKSDGTVVATGSTIMGRCNVGHWQDIVAVACSNAHTVGVKSNGTVVATGFNEKGQSNVDQWQNIVAVACGPWHTVGLKSNGTVVATGDNRNGRCNVSQWQNIVAVACNNHHTVGLKSDGTVVATGDNSDGQCDVGHWQNIVAVACGLNHTAGLRSDGTVVAVGSNMFGQCNVSHWKNISVIACGFYLTVGLRANGTVAAVGINDSGQCDVFNWKLFDSLDTLAEERKHAEMLWQEARKQNEARMQAIAQLRAKRKTLGMFASQEKKEIDEQIARLEAQITAL